MIRQLFGRRSAHPSVAVNGDLSALRNHQRRLLIGGGIALSLVILLRLAAVIALLWDGNRDERLAGFNRAIAEVDALMGRRDAGYVRSLNLAEYAWIHHRYAGTAATQDLRALYLGSGQSATVQSSEDGTPLLALGQGTDIWPEDKLDRYLGLAEELSVIDRTSITGAVGEQGASAYFYEPQGQFFTLAGAKDEAQLRANLAVSDRGGLLRSLMALGPDIVAEQQRHILRPGHPILSSHRADAPTIVTSLRVNPVTGLPAVTSTFVAFQDNEPIGAFVVFEPIDGYVEAVRKAGSGDFMVVTQNGDVVFDTTGDGGSGWPRAWAAGASSELADGRQLLRVGGSYFISRPIKGTEWRLVHRYRWQDVAKALSSPLATALGIAVLVLAGIWTLLIYLDRRVFLPAIRRAQRVYQSEELSRSIIGLSPVGLCLIDAQSGESVLENDLARDYHARTRGGLYGRLLDGFAAATTSPAGRPEGREFRLAVNDMDGEDVRHLLVAATPVQYQDRTVYLCALRDLTSRIEFERTLKRAQEEAESASRAKSAFVAAISHELRTPLNGMMGHLELIGRSTLNHGQRERLIRMRESADSLLGVISDVLDFSKIEAGQLDVEHSSFRLRSLAERVALLFAPSAQAKGVGLHLRIDPELCVADCEGAVLQVEQVLRNLVSNAVKFTASGRVAIHATRVPGGEADGCRVAFSVIDSGIGVSAAQQGRLFDPFVQADNTIARRFGGTGLGLSLCRQLCQLLGGDIGMQSTPGVGSVFRFEIPLRVAGSGRLSPDALRGRRVALLSSVGDWRDDISGLLMGLGADVRAASHPAQMDATWASEADALLVFDQPLGAWNESEQSAQRPRVVIRALEDGPLAPEREGEGWVVSCYASDALVDLLLRGTVAMEPDPRTEGRIVPGSRGRALLVDDHPASRELVKEQLETLGFVVDPMKQAHDALLTWGWGKYELVVTDVHMPEIDGLELCRELRSLGAVEPIVILTGDTSTEARLRSEECGASILLLKPLSIPLLNAALTDAGV